MIDRSELEKLGIEFDVNDMTMDDVCYRTTEIRTPVGDFLFHDNSVNELEWVEIIHPDIEFIKSIVYFFAESNIKEYQFSPGLARLLIG